MPQSADLDFHSIREEHFGKEPSVVVLSVKTPSGRLRDIEISTTKLAQLVSEGARILARRIAAKEL